MCSIPPKRPQGEIGHKVQILFLPLQQCLFFDVRLRGRLFLASDLLPDSKGCYIDSHPVLRDGHSGPEFIHGF